MSERVNSRTLELPNSRTPELSPRSGYTLIELVASLALFVMILGMLMTVLNSATDMWSGSRGQKREQTVAAAITDLIADDLYQAVSDISESADLYKSFYLYSPDPTNTHPDTVTILLAFLRPASPRTRIPAGLGSGTRTSLDAVFYTAYSHALFRHAIPVTLDFAQAVTNGVALPHEFLTETMPLVNDPSLHQKLLDPSATPPATSSSLLAERILPTFLAHYLDDPDPKPDDVQSDLPPQYLDLSLHLFSAEEWGTYQSGFNDSSPSALLKRAHLGTLVSRRITLPQAGGSRLP
ncbi:MAG: hypothetical protein RBT78_11395 [Kiritimatiellia bacterium]|jgi:hypothetical protein|nr:hypothetical protein [Kiritimatiellia bacterium]